MYEIKEVKFSGIGFSLVIKDRYLTDHIFEAIDKMGFVWLTVYRRKDSFRIDCHMKLNL